MTNNNVNAKLYNNFDTIKHQPQKIFSDFFDKKAVINQMS